MPNVADGPTRRLDDEARNERALAEAEQLPKAIGERLRGRYEQIELLRNLVARAEKVLVLTDWSDPIWDEIARLDMHAEAALSRSRLAPRARADEAQSSATQALDASNLRIRGWCEALEIVLPGLENDVTLKQAQLDVRREASRRLLFDCNVLVEGGIANAP